MDNQSNPFFAVAGGVFVGGLALVLAVVFWPIALGILGVIVALGAIALFFANETFRNIVVGIVAIVLAILFYRPT